ncbi:MAG TPA: protein translocase subunit SecD [bacterium]|nr:protein translocase subunit SecD [bacterium]
MKKTQINITLIFAAFILAAYALYPTFRWYSKSESEREDLERIKDPIVGKILKLGLDLRGGMHLVLEIEKEKIPQGTSLEGAVERALEILRNRVDQFGVSEPLITRQGEQWIVVQLPGVKDPERAIDLIGKTALLEFRLLNEERLTEALDGKIPEGYELLKGKSEESYLIKKEAEVTGAALSNAKVEIGGTYNMPYISLEFNTEGAKSFARVTEMNINKRLAIVLDNVVQSAPVIRSKIPNGKAIIEGNFTMEEASNLAIILRAGALPAPVRIIENRTVGPTLGSDSIKKGVTSCIVGFLAVAVFLAFYYKLGGIIADISLFFNLFLVMGIMALLKATLTLPGIAGLILTIGMNDDANILIYERIKEELRSGKTIRSALDVGYVKAFTTILDSQLTTLIAAAFLFQFGTGPIKGFAVTLFWGIITGIFTGVLVTHTIWNIILGRKKWEKLPI